MLKQTFLQHRLLLLALALGLTIPAAAALAAPPSQENNGSIRGVVYEDVNADGICVGAGEPVLAAIPLEFVGNDGATVVNLSTDAGGNFAFVGAALGRWQVTVVPGEAFRITSEETVEVLLTSDEPTAAGYSFCVARVTAASGGGAVVLPESGAFLPPPLLAAALVGAGLLAAGALLELWRRLKAI